MRPSLLVLVVSGGCSSEPSRLDGLMTRPAPVVRVADAADAAMPLDEADQDLQRKLREVTARPLHDSPHALDAAALGAHPRPFGPLDPLRPQMTRAEVVAAIPGAQVDGALLWVPTGIDDVTVEISFDRHDRLHDIVYQMPLAARPILVEAWGPPVPNAETWFDRERGWRARLGEDAIKRKVAVTISGFTPFADLIGRGPDGLAEATTLIGATLRELDDRFGARLISVSTTHGFVELAMPQATDVCSTATELGLELDRVGAVDRVMLLQCYDDNDVNRRAALEAMERHWGPASAVRTRDDRLVFAWSRPGRRIEAQPVQHARQWMWEVSIRAAPK